MWRVTAALLCCAAVSLIRCNNRGEKRKGRQPQTGGRWSSPLHREWSAASQHMQRQRRDGLFDERVRRCNLKRHLSEEEKALPLSFSFTQITYVLSRTKECCTCVALCCVVSILLFFFLQKAFLFVFIFVVNGCVRSCVVRLCHVMTS